MNCIDPKAICHICNRPHGEEGEPYCSAPHGDRVVQIARLAHEYEARIRDLEAAVAVLAAECDAWRDRERYVLRPDEPLSARRRDTNSNAIASAALAASKEGRDGK